MYTINLRCEGFSAILKGSYHEGITVNYGDLRITWNKVIAEDVEFTFRAEEDGAISLSFSKQRMMAIFNKCFALESLNLTDDSFYPQTDGFIYSANYYFSEAEDASSRPPLGEINSNSPTESDASL